MSKYDKDREKLGLGTVGGQSSSIDQNSKYAKDREALFNPPAIQDNAPITASPSMDELEQEKIQMIQQEPSLAPASSLPTDWQYESDSLPGRDIPVIGNVLRGLDWVGDKVEPVANIARSLYTPGGGLAPVQVGYEAIGGLLSKVAPKLGSTLGGRVAQEAIKEAGVGVPLSAGQAFAQGETDISEQAKQGLIGGGLGAVTGGAAPLIGAALRNSKLGSLLNRSKAPDVAPATEMLALPPASRYESAKARAEGNVLPRNEAPIYGQGDVKTFELPVGRDDAEWSRLRSEETLSLPSYKRYEDAVSRSRQTPGTNPIEASGDIKRLGLPEPSPQMRNFEDAQKGIAELDRELSRLDSQREIAVREQYNYLKQSRDGRGGIQQGQLQRDIHGDVTGRTGRISNNPKWYQDFYAENGKVPSNKDLWDLARKHVDEGYDEGVFQVPSWAKENGYHETRQTLAQVRQQLADELDTLYPEMGEAAITKQLRFKPKPKRAQEVAASQTKMSLDEVSRLVQGVNRLKRMQDIRRPEVLSQAAPLRDTVGRKPIRQTAEQPKPVKPQQQETPSKYAKEREAITERLVTPKPQGNVDELKFAQTVKDSPNSAAGLVDAMKDTPLKGARTSDVMNRKQADDLIEKHGREGLYSKLVSKKVTLSPAESTAAQKLAKHYSSQGGKENMAKAIALIGKTAREGREMGQAIQALSQWNKLDETGALLLGERQLNRGVKDTADWRSLTPEQAAPIQEAAQRVGQAQEVKSLADEVMGIVTNKKPGEALTDVEKATIKQFQDQVKEINEKTKPFLPKAKSDAAETIAKVSKVPPKERTRDQVVSFLDAKAEAARKRIEARRNVGILPKVDNPVFDYAIIGASHVAKGVRDYADYSELMIKDFGEQVKPFMKEAYLKSVNMFRRENGLPTKEDLEKVVNTAIKANKLDTETANSLRVVATEIGFYADKNLKLEATQDLQKALKELGDSSLGEKVSTVLTGAQLLNAVTIGRNVIGNVGQQLLEKINKINAVPIDWALSQITKERTIKFFPHNQEKQWKNIMLGGMSGYEGVSPTGTLASYDIHPEVFGKKNPLKYISKALGFTLQSFDYGAYRAAYGDVVATYAEQLGKAQGLTKAQIKQGMPDLIKQLDESIHELADQAGLYATFQDETLLSEGAQLVKQGLNAITDFPMQKLVKSGMLPRKYSTEGFGLGDIVLKYARTPANLVMRGIDYSPIGLLRGIGYLMPLFKSGAKFNQFEATRALSRAITGTLGLTGMGYVLADAGVLTGSYSMDKDVRSIEEQSGQGSYKVNFSAMQRFIMGGLDKDAAKYQKGDKMMDYAWLQPAAISVAMGVNANKAMKERKDGDISGWKVAQKAILGGLSSVLENPMVQGLTNVIDAGTEVIKYQKADKLKGIVKGVPASFVPTLSNQARTATDNVQRETFDENLLTEMGNMIKNKIPGWSKSLPASYDSLGKPRERIQGGEENTVGQYLTAFFSPARFTEYKVGPEAKLVLDLMEQSGDKNVLPTVSAKSIEIDNPLTQKAETIKLTNEQYSRLQKQVGEETSKKLQAISDFLANPSVRTEVKVKRVKDILSDVGQKARNDVRAEMGYRKKAIR